ncbi:hypothetical protein DSO57_1007293 [Entomophthora muscae]|uniref:Uncharacterized protein n=1 Tax=Entomophthora muscae TaxID=34485 RepID=A0ACC2UTQ9_9FUNG|nr:hypothetical protein DSO57_1007293 [Entomophthora muscae]
MDTIKRSTFPATKRAQGHFPILQYPNREGVYKLETGEVLQIQTAEKDFLPVAYESRKLSDSEQRYPIHDKELVVIVGNSGHVETNNVNTSNVNTIAK